MPTLKDFTQILWLNISLENIRFIIQLHGMDCILMIRKKTPGILMFKKHFRLD